MFTLGKAKQQEIDHWSVQQRRKPLGIDSKCYLAIEVTLMSYFMVLPQAIDLKNHIFITLIHLAQLDLQGVHLLHLGNKLLLYNKQIYSYKFIFSVNFSSNAIGVLEMMKLY